jgi:hypothetical protein
MLEAAVSSEIRAMFGSMPLVFARMQESGDLVHNWPGIRELYTHPEPLRHEVVHALMAALALRCRRGYCFVLHSLALVEADAKPLEIAKLARLLKVPDVVPDAERWTRVVRLAWLADAPGPQRRAAAYALELECTPEEHAQVLHTCAVGALLTSYVDRYDLDVAEEPGLDLMPAELRALVPDFVQFHANIGAGHGVGERPVCTVCSYCGAVRVAAGATWYPREIAASLLPDNALFSHGLCSVCAASFGLDGSPASQA